MTLTIQPTTHNSQPTTQGGRLRSLLADKEGLGITVPQGLLPPFLLEANALLRSGRVEQAKALLGGGNLRLLEDQVASDPTLTDLMFVAARLLAEVGQPQAAEPWYRRILSMESHAQVWADLAKVVFVQGPSRIGEVVDCWEQAHRLEPDRVEFKVAYADSLMRFGRVSQGVALLQQVLERSPDCADFVQSWLWNLQYLPGPDREFFFNQYTRLGRLYDRTSEARRTPRPARTFDPDRRVRVGIVSGDFKTNSPASAYEPFIEMCDRRGFEMFGYGSVEDPDEDTARIRSLFDAYRDIRDCPDERMAEQIRQDSIDILMEIGGHSAGTRLPVFRLQPAPAQVDLGGINTLGVPQIGYRITDEMLDPPDTQRFYAERLVYLPGGVVTYRPPAESPLVGPQPATINGTVTLGSFNNFRKINDSVLSTWAQILRQIPDAILVLKWPTADCAAVRDYMRQRFERSAIDPGRIRFCGQTSHFDHLSLMSQVDLMLDCFPFNGCRTTADGLWMGVPTVTLAGPTFVSQMGRAIVTRVGLEAFVAHSPAEYVAKVCAFAPQREALGQIRQSLRQRMVSSNLCDPNRFTRDLEQALRWIWKDTCAKGEGQGATA
jgi:protein O-GlcNAc transferase